MKKVYPPEPLDVVIVNSKKIVVELYIYKDPRELYKLPDGTLIPDLTPPTPQKVQYDPPIRSVKRRKRVRKVRTDESIAPATT